MLLVQLTHGTSFRLNGTGRVIWELAITSLTTGEIVEQLKTRFEEIPILNLERDVTALLAELTRYGLLTQHREAAR